MRKKKLYYFKPLRFGFVNSTTDNKYTQMSVLKVFTASLWLIISILYFDNKKC